jgi:hypothetical protein
MKTEVAIGIGLVALVVLLAAQGAGASQADVHPVIVRALEVENDPAILRTFASKLRAAGYVTEASIVDARAVDIGPIGQNPNVAPTVQGGVSVSQGSLSLRQAMGQ